MVLNGLLIVIAVGSILWLAASTRILFGGRLANAIVAAGVVSGAGAAASFVALAAPRYSAFWTGSAGGGDGLGLVGYILVGGAAFLLGFVLMAISCGLAAMRDHFARPKGAE